MATTETTSTDELSREFSNLSTSSSVADAKSDISVNNGNNNVDDLNYSDDDDFNDTDDSDDGKISRQDTSVSVKSGKLSRQRTSATSASSRPSSSRPTTGMSSVGTSRENTIENHIDDREDIVSRESTQDSHFSSSHTKMRPDSVASSTTTSEASNGAVSRENTNVSLASNYSDGDGTHHSKALSRESTGASHNTDVYNDDFQEKHDGNVSVSSSRQQSFVSKTATDTDENSDDEDDEDGKKLEKENSVLIEKDGKFELVDEKNLTVDQRNALGLTKRSKQKPNTLGLPASDRRIRKSSNPEYDHVKSSKRTFSSTIKIVLK